MGTSVLTYNGRYRLRRAIVIEKELHESDAKTCDLYGHLELGPDDDFYPGRFVKDQIWGEEGEAAKTQQLVSKKRVAGLSMRFCF